MSKNLHFWLALLTVGLGGSVNFAFEQEILQNGVIIGNDYYFWDSVAVNRNRASALAYCVSNDAVLAKILDLNHYNIIRLGIPVLGTYWIDGLDKANFSQFQLTDGNPYPNTTDIPLESFVFTPRSCLNLKKGVNATESGIHSLDCASATHRVLCQLSLAKLFALD